MLAAGASRQQIDDALAVCLAFNITDRLADAFDFLVASPAAMDAGARSCSGAATAESVSVSRQHEEAGHLAVRRASDVPQPALSSSRGLQESRG